VAFFGFGGYDTDETVGTPEDVAAELAGLLNSLDLTEVRAACHERGQFGLVLEVEAHEGERPASRGRNLPPAAEERVPRWRAEASSGSGAGIFDAAYDCGNGQDREAEVVGTAEQVAAELAVLLRALTRADVEAMQGGTARYFVHALAPGREMPARAPRRAR
jgi:hypothetical protein